MFTANSINELLLYLIDIEYSSDIKFNYFKKTYNGTYFGIFNNNIIIGIESLVDNAFSIYRTLLNGFNTKNIPTIEEYKFINKYNSNKQYVYIIRKSQPFVFNIITNEEYSLNHMIKYKSTESISCHLIERISIK